MHDGMQGDKGNAGIATALRRLMLAVVIVGAVGLLAELLLIEHFDDPWQFAPLVLLGVVVLVALGVAAWPRPGLLRAFRVLMALCLAAGALGVWLHYQGNVEFASEQDPSLRGFALVWESLRGATPALAPGALAQLGLLGLIYTYHHPALAAGGAITLRENQ